MEEKTKQRLIGLIVLIGVLLIILPFLFHNSRPTPSNPQVVPASPQTTVPVTLPADSNASNTTVASVPINPTPSMPAAPATATTPSSVPASTMPVPQTVGTSGSPVLPATPTMPTPNAPTMPNPNMPSPVTAPAPSVTAPAPTQAAPPTVSNAVGQNNRVVVNPAKFAQKQPETVSDTAAFMPDQSVSSASGLTTGGVASNDKQAVVAAAVVPATSIKVAHHKALVKTAAHSHKHLVAHAHKKEAWALQVGAFSNRANANKLVAELHKKHIAAYTHATVHNHKSLIIVYAGPEKNKLQTVALQRKIRNELHLSSMVKTTRA